MRKKNTVKSVTNILEELFPLNIAEEWDKVGVQIGSTRKIVKTIAVALDLTNELVDYAVENKTDLIITFHPFLFNDDDFGRVPKQNWKRKVSERLINSGITTYSMHTAFDKEPKGMPLAVTRKLDLEYNSKPIKGLEYGVVLEWNKTLGQLMQHFKNTFDIDVTLSNVDKKRDIINNFAFIPGSGSCDDIQTTWNNNDIDLVITSDIKWSDWITLNQEKINVMEVSHIVESAFIEHIVNFLTKMLKDINIISFEAKKIIKHF